MKIAACIGHRDISLEITEYLKAIGSALANREYFLSSGNAEGSDFAFAQGFNIFYPERVYLYLPWKGFNQEQIHRNNLTVIFDPIQHLDHKEVVDNLLKYPKRDSIMKLFYRNSLIVSKANIVIAYAKHYPSGTHFAIKLASYYKVPVVNIADKDGQDFIKKELEVFL